METNFKKVFTIFFVALGIFALASIAMGGILDTRLLERLLLTGLRERIFTDPMVLFRNIGYLFLITFHGLLAWWVQVNSKNKAWTVATAITGLVGWLCYMIIHGQEKEVPKCQ